MPQALPAQGTIRKTDSGLELSLYADHPATDSAIAGQVARLKAAFPKVEGSFFNILAERIVANGFTDKRLADAVSHVIDTFRYKEINVADVIGYDRRAKLYSESEYIAAQRSGVRHTEFERRDVGGEPYWVKKSEILSA